MRLQRMGRLWKEETMGFKVEEGRLEGVLVLTADVYTDERGSFQETFHQQRYRDAGLIENFVQDNWSRSARGVLRGLHYQIERPQGKLVYVVRGEIFDVAVDLRPDSPTFRQWEGVVLNDRDGRQIYVPPGFAHGFCVLSESADVIYKCTDVYHKAGERGVLWSDPDVAIEWPIKNPALSPKDKSLPRLKEIPPTDLPSRGDRSP